MKSYGTERQTRGFDEGHMATWAAEGFHTNGAARKLGLGVRDKCLVSAEPGCGIMCAACSYYDQTLISIASLCPLSHDIFFTSLATDGATFLPSTALSLQSSRAVKAVCQSEHTDCTSASGDSLHDTVEEQLPAFCHDTSRAGHRSIDTVP